MIVKNSELKPLKKMELLKLGMFAFFSFCWKWLSKIL